MPAISVIIPIYNVEQYLKQCLDSVVNQTFKDLEIILVDDGSPDNCGSICDEYALRDSRIIVIHKKNEGLSAARNSALEVAKGEWISFVDSDDWLEVNTYEEVYGVTLEYKPEIVLFDRFFNYNKKEKVCYSFKKDFVNSDRNFIEKVQLAALSTKASSLDIGWSQGAPWDKLYRAELIKNNHILFPTNVKANEDVIFNVKIYQCVKRLAYVHKAFYHYRQTGNSIVYKYDPDRIEKDKDIYNELNNIGKVNQLGEAYYQAVYSRMIENLRLCGFRFLYNKNNKCRIKQKINYANVIVKEYPYAKILKSIKVENVNLKSRLILYGDNKGLNIYLLYLARSIYKKIVDN